MLDGAAGHDVRAEVVVDGPVGIEAEGFDEAGEVEVLFVDLLVRDGGRTRTMALEAVPIGVVLEVEVDASAHEVPPKRWRHPTAGGGRHVGIELRQLTRRPDDQG